MEALYTTHRLPLPSATSCFPPKTHSRFLRISTKTLSKNPTKTRISIAGFSPFRSFSPSTPTFSIFASSHKSFTEETQQKKPPQTINSIVKTGCIVLTATALFFGRFLRPALANPIPVPIPTVESARNSSKDSENLPEEEKEQILEEYLEEHPEDIRSLKALMEVKIKARKLSEAIGVVERLMIVDPTEKEWPLLKAHLQSYEGDVEAAKQGFEEILSKDPLMVEAYHGLVVAMSQSGELAEVLQRIESAMERCKKEKRKEDLRDFKLLLAQVRVIEGKYDDSLKLYQELVKEEPRDFRPYLCQGIIYTLLGKKDEAEKQFGKYKRLVPKGHPYARYFDDNMLATKVFSQMAENQRVSDRK